MAGAAFATSLVLALTFIYSHWMVHSHGTGPHEGIRLLWQEEVPTLIGPLAIGIVMIAVKLVAVRRPSSRRRCRCGSR